MREVDNDATLVFEASHRVRRRKRRPKRPKSSASTQPSTSVRSEPEILPGTTPTRIDSVVALRMARPRCRSNRRDPSIVCEPDGKRKPLLLHHRVDILTDREAGVRTPGHRRRFHLTKSSACCKTESGIVSPRALAVFRLTTSSNFLGCSMGKSPGFAPWSIRSTYPADRRKTSPVFGP